MTAPTPFFPGFSVRQVEVPGARLHVEVGGNGPPLLLLHGYPQTHVAWHRIAPVLARHYTVVAPDLRGYGDSTGPDTAHAGAADGDEPHLAYCKRTLAGDQLALMRQLGFDRFGVVAHDRGARVGYRLALDRPEAVRCFTSLAVVPTADVWPQAGMAFGLKNPHWYLFAQPFDVPERLLMADPLHFFDAMLPRMSERPGAVTPEALAEYRRAFLQPSVRHAMMEDYRAAASTDLAHDRADIAAGRRLACPVQVLWSASSRADPTPLAVWHRWCDHPDAVEGSAIDCGHLMAEEAPDEVLAQVLPFLARHLAG